MLDNTIFPPCGMPIDSLRVHKHSHSVIVSSSLTRTVGRPVCGWGRSVGLLVSAGSVGQVTVGRSVGWSVGGVGRSDCHSVSQQWLVVVSDCGRLRQSPVGGSV